MARVLYVDDDPILVRLVQKSLGRAGMELAHAPDAQTAEALLAAEDFQVVVLDHYLPTGTGLDILRRMREGGAATPTIYVTGSSEASVAIDALKTGADDYVIKTAGDDFLLLLRGAIEKSITKAALQAAKERADAETRAARERAEMLLAEVNHRVANSLAMVTSLLRLQASASSSEDVRRALAEAQVRIAAISGVHRSLYQTDDVRTVLLDGYLDAMLKEFAQTIPDTIRITQHVAPVGISADRAVSLGIIVSELATNAAKYAWPDGRPGELTFTLTEEGDDLRLVVADDGIGADPEGVTHGTGLGQKLVRAMAVKLGGEIIPHSPARGTMIETRFPRTHLG